MNDENNYRLIPIISIFIHYIIFFYQDSDLMDLEFKKDFDEVLGGLEQIPTKGKIFLAVIQIKISSIKSECVLCSYR